MGTGRHGKRRGSGPLVLGTVNKFSVMDAAFDLGAVLIQRKGLAFCFQWAQAGADGPFQRGTRPAPR